MSHTHTMTEEFTADMKALQDAAAALPSSSSYVKPLQALTQRLREAEPTPQSVSDAIAAMRERLQPEGQGCPISTMGRGLWAVGLGGHPLSDHNDLEKVLGDPAGKAEIARLGGLVEAFCAKFKEPDGKGGRIIELIEGALVDGAKDFPPELQEALRHLLTKVQQMAFECMQTTSSTLSLPPPYYWPSTYISSSSSSSSSSSPPYQWPNPGPGSSSSSSTWPPPAY